MKKAFLLYGVADRHFYLRMIMAASLGRVLLNRPLFYRGLPTDKGRTGFVVIFRRNLVKKPKSVIGSNIKTSMGIDSAKVSLLLNVYFPMPMLPF